MAYKTGKVLLGCRCVSRPALCAEQGQALARAAGQPLSEDLVELFPSRAACCRPGLGAFAQGCRSSA